MLRVGVVLSGSGRFDGSEIHESVLTLLAIDRAGAQAYCVAPNKNQREVIDHVTTHVARETRNILTESARIARGQIRDIREVQAADLDAVILPGGYGAAKNLSDFVWKGERCWVDGDVYRLLREMYAAKKPIGAVCIAPAVLAKVFSPEKPKLTIGRCENTAAALQAMGARHVSAGPDEIVVDEQLGIVTTPAYMLAERISEVASGIERLVSEVIRMAKRRQADSAVSRVVPRDGRGQPADSSIGRVAGRTRKAQPADSSVARIDRRARSRVSRSNSRAARPVTRRRTVRA